MRFFTNKAVTLIASESLKLSSDTLKVVLFTGQKTGTCTNGSGVITGIASTTGLLAGMYLTESGGGFASGTVINSVDSGTQITVSNNFSGSTGAKTLTAHPHEDFDFMSQVNSLECSGTGYTSGFGGAGRKTLGARTFTEDDANNRVKIIPAANLSWSGLNAGVLTGFGLIKEVTNDAASPLILYCADGGFPITTNGGTFDLIWDANGIATFTVTVQ